jgi:DNA-binding NarL/FixJ family response regulator
MEVLSYVTKGMSNKEIALLLGISQQTVKNHVTSVLRKLGVEDRTQAAIFAIRRGWVRVYQTDIESQE